MEKFYQHLKEASSLYGRGIDSCVVAMASHGAAAELAKSTVNDANGALGELQHWSPFMCVSI